MLAVLEVYVILRFMGARVAMGGAFIVEALTKVINLVGAFNPGNFGTYEGGNMLIAKDLWRDEYRWIDAGIVPTCAHRLLGRGWSHVHDHSEEGRGAEDNSGEARSRSRAVPR